jgi:hypothetical protein
MVAHGSGYVLVGDTTSWGAGGWDAYMVCVDADGNRLWNTTIGGTEYDRGSDIIAVRDGFIVAGTTSSWGMGNYDLWLFKTDLNGNHLWNYTFGSCGYDYGFSLIECADGDLTLVGYIDNGASGHDLYLVHTDTAGSDYWTKTIGDTLDDRGYDLVEYSGGYVICGYTQNYGVTSGAGWLVRTDGSGNHQWNQTFDGPMYDTCHSIIECSSGGFAIAGVTASYGVSDYAAWLIKTNTAGTHQWNQTYDAFGYDEAIDVIECGDGGFAIAGYVEHPYTSTRGSFLRSPQPYDGLLLRTDTNGNQLWNSTYGTSGSFDEECYHCIVEDGTGAFLTAGETAGFAVAGDDAWLVKTSYPLAWNPAPTDQAVPQGVPFAYDLDVSSHFDIASWSVNDTGFNIDSNGVVSSALLLPVGIFGLRVTVVDAVGSEITGDFTVTVVPSLIPLLPAIAAITVIIIVLIIILLYFFMFRKKRK